MAQPNQKLKSDLVMKEVEKAEGKGTMHRSIGRMFVLCSADEIKGDLNKDTESITTEIRKNNALKKTLEDKRDEIIKQLNDLSPNAAKWANK